MKTKLSGKFWAALTLFSLMGQVAWVVENMYLNVFIERMLLEIHLKAVVE